MPLLAAPTMASAQGQRALSTPTQHRSASVHAPRCTVTGTPGNDRLVGSSHRDVICGGGGNDVLIGRGGNDVLIGGRGNDVLRGGAGRDVLRGGAGRDRLVGGDGNDKIVGGSGADVELGDDGSDQLRGGLGNDDLTGGPKADALDGGPGTNWCTLDPADTSAQCVYDRTPAQADQVTFSTDNVDVTDSAQTVTIRIHVTDDTGVTTVQVNPDGTPWYPDRNIAHLVSGDIRNGWWEATIRFPRWVRAGTFTPLIRTWDRVNRVNTNTFPDTQLTVRDDDPDTSLPELTLLTPDPNTSYNAKPNGVYIPLEAHITDVGSGVNPANLYVVLWAPTTGVGDGGGLHLVSGDLHDGIWKGQAWVDPGQEGGDWNLEIFVSDKANGGTDYGADYWGPVAYGRTHEQNRDNRLIPNGMGSVHIVGSAADHEAPTATNVISTPDTVDTLAHAASVSVSVDANDTGGAGLLGVNAYLIPADGDPDAPTIQGELSGPGSSLDNGTWTGTIAIPQGIPPGTYYLEIVVFDLADNQNYYIGADYPDSWFGQRLTNTPTVTVVDSS